LSVVDDVARAWRALLLGDEPRFFSEPAASLDRQQVYRTLVRRTLSGAVQRACPHAWRLTGDAVFSSLLERCWAEAPPSTRRMHELAGQFAAWSQDVPPHELPHPAFSELCHFEALELEVTMAKTAQDLPTFGELVVDLDDVVVVVVDPSTRLCAYRHPVHRVTAATTDWPAASTAPTFLLCFQRDEAFVVDVVSPAVARLLVMSQDGVPVGLALRGLAATAASSNVAFDPERVRSDLVDLQRRGALAGFQPQARPS
jgi:hypothetical protein